MRRLGRRVLVLRAAAGAGAGLLAGARPAWAGICTDPPAGPNCQATPGFQDGQRAGTAAVLATAGVATAALGAPVAGAPAGGTLAGKVAGRWLRDHGLIDRTPDGKGWRPSGALREALDFRRDHPGQPLPPGVRDALREAGLGGIHNALKPDGTIAGGVTINVRTGAAPAPMPGTAAGPAPVPSSSPTPVPEASAAPPADTTTPSAPPSPPENVTPKTADPTAPVKAATPQDVENTLRSGREVLIDPNAFPGGLGGLQLQKSLGGDRVVLEGRISIGGRDLPVTVPILFGPGPLRLGAAPLGKEIFPDPKAYDAYLKAYDNYVRALESQLRNQLGPVKEVFLDDARGGNLLHIKPGS